MLQGLKELLAIQMVKRGKKRIFSMEEMDTDYYLCQAITDFSYKGMNGTGIAEMGINLNLYDIDIKSTF